MSSADELPDNFDTFAGTRVCETCSERVAVEHYREAHGICAGCYWEGKL